MSKKKDPKHKDKKSEGKHGKDKKSEVHFCTGCRNFRPSKGGAGVCKRTGKNRAAGAKACGHFDSL